MRQVLLQMDFIRYVNGKEIRYKAGETIPVTTREYNVITNALIQHRIATRKKFEAIPGSPEWKATHK